MKTKNFPAKKLSRQISADLRANSPERSPTKTMSAKDVYRDDIHQGGALTQARAKRTKTKRG